MTLSFESRQVADLAQHRFERRLGQLLIDTLPDARGVIDQPGGRQALRRQSAKARSYGLAAELDVARYVITAFFPARPDILKMLLAAGADLSRCLLGARHRERNASGQQSEQQSSHRVSITRSGRAVCYDPATL